MKRKLRAATGMGALLAATATLLGAPGASLGHHELPLVGEVHRMIERVDAITETVAPRRPAAAVPAPGRVAQTPGSGGYQPPLHGSTPHGQGSVATLDIQPSGTRPLAGDPTGEGDMPGDREEVVVGRARGEQGQDGRYNGHVTIVALFGNEVLGTDTDPGETAAGPLDPIQTNVLDQLCQGSGDNICLEVLRADSATTDTGSTNSFAVARAGVGGQQGISTGVAESNGNVSQDGSCQTAHGDSSAARVSAGGSAVADALQSSSDSRACSDGTQTQEASSTVIGLGGQGVPIPAAGCANGTPDTVTGIPTIAPIVCNADDSNGTGEQILQATAPYGVREALTVFALEAGGTALLKAVTSASESRAAAPAQTPPAGPDDGGDVVDEGPETPEEETPGDGDGPGDGGDGGGGPGGGPGGGGPTADDASLAQTGLEVVVIALLGLVALALGLALHSAAGREGTRPAR